MRVYVYVYVYVYEYVYLATISNVLSMFWTSVGHVLGMFRICFGCVLAPCQFQLVSRVLPPGRARRRADGQDDREGAEAAAGEDRQGLPTKVRRRKAARGLFVCFVCSVFS